MAQTSKLPLPHVLINLYVLIYSMWTLTLVYTSLYFHVIYVQLMYAGSEAFEMAAVKKRADVHSQEIKADKEKVYIQ